MSAEPTFWENPPPLLVLPDMGRLHKDVRRNSAEKIRYATQDSRQTTEQNCPILFWSFRNNRLGAHPQCECQRKKTNTRTNGERSESSKTSVLLPSITHSGGPTIEFKSKLKKPMIAPRKSFTAPGKFIRSMDGKVKFMVTKCETVIQENMMLNLTK